MSANDFWHEEPELFWAYRFSYIKRLEREQEIMNQNAWLNGLYVYEAVSTTLHNSFRDKNDQVKQYRDKPIDFNEKAVQLSKEEKRKLLDDKIKSSLRSKQQLLNNKKKV